MSRAHDVLCDRDRTSFTSDIVIFPAPAIASYARASFRQLRFKPYLVHESSSIFPQIPVNLSAFLKSGSFLLPGCSLVFDAIPMYKAKLLSVHLSFQIEW
jgi:hypothetical protein